jgi:hypothetical protein
MDMWQASHILIAVTMVDYIAGTKDQEDSATQVLSKVASGPGYVSP